LSTQAITVQSSSIQNSLFCEPTGFGNKSGRDFRMARRDCKMRAGNEAFATNSYYEILCGASKSLWPRCHLEEPSFWQTGDRWIARLGKLHHRCTILIRRGKKLSSSQTERGGVPGIQWPVFTKTDCFFEKNRLQMGLRQSYITKAQKLPISA